MTTATAQFNAAWNGWSLEVDGRSLGRIEADTANGYRVHLNDGSPQLPFSFTECTTLGEAFDLLDDYASAVHDAVDFGELSYQGDGIFAMTPLEWGNG